MSNKEIEEPAISSYNIFFTQISSLVDKIQAQSKQQDNITILHDPSKQIENNSIVDGKEQQSKDHKENDTAIKKELENQAQITNIELNKYIIGELLPENQQDITSKAFERLTQLNDDETKRLSDDAHQSLFRMLTQNYLGAFISAGLFKLITVFFLFAAPWFLDSLSSSLKEYKKVSDQQQSSEYAHSLCKQIYINGGLLALSFLLFTICDSQYSYWIKKLSTILKQYLQANIYAHALLKKSYTKYQQNSNTFQDAVFDDKLAQSSSIHANLNNLITIDVDTIINFLISFHETWSLILKLIIGLSLLYIKMQSAVLVGFIVTFILMMINFYIAKRIGSIFEQILKHKDQRVGLTRDILNGIRQIQLLNWQNIFFQKILDFRNHEFRQISYEKYLDAFCVFFWASSSLAISAVTFILYYRKNKTFEEINVFTAIYLFEMLIGPLNALPWTISGLIMSKTSFSRFNEFLQLPNIYKYQNKYQTNYAIQIKNISAMWPSVKEDSEHQDDKDIKEQNNVSDLPTSKNQGDNTKSLQNNTGSHSQTGKSKQSQKQSFSESIKQLNENEQRMIKNNRISALTEKEEDNDTTPKTIPNKTPSSKNVSFQFGNQKLNNKGQQIDSNHNLQAIDSASSEFSLKIDKIIIPKGAFVIVNGNTASGKTAFLKTLLSELNVTDLDSSLNSSLKVQGSIAYVSQNSWLYDSSLRSNILFFTPYEKKYYRACIFASCLHDDISQFEDLDLHEIGINGGKLSGGQQQRVCIARALYSRKDIFLFDNIFSSVDVEVADHIFKFGLRSLLRDKTVILASSNQRYNQYADYIINITDSNEVFIIDNQEKLELQFNEHVDLNIVQIYDGTALRKAIATEQQNNENTIIELQKQPVNQGEQIQEQIDEEIHLRLEPRARGLIDNNVIWLYLKHIGWFFLIMITLSLILMQLSQNFYYVWLKQYVNGEPIFLIGNSSDKFIFTLIALCVFNLFVTLFRAFSFAYGNLLASQSIFLTLTQSVIFQKARFFTSHSIGAIISRFAGDTAAVDYQISFNLNILLKIFFTIVGSFAVIASQMPLTLVIIGIILMFYYFIQAKYRESSREIKRLDSANTSAMLTLINESAFGIQIVRAYDQEQVFNKRFFLHMKNCSNTNLLLSILSIWFSIRLQLLSLFLTFSLIAYSCASVFFPQFFQRYAFLLQVDSNTLALCLVYSIEITNLLRNLILTLTETEKEFISLERISQYITEGEDELKLSKEYESKMLNQSSLLRRKIMNDFAIEFHEVFMTYETVNDKQNNQQQNPEFVLKGISFQIQKGKKYGIVGKTGSGKSSIFNCLFKIYDYQDGEIYINGENIKFIKDEYLSSFISIIPQHGFLFSGTVKENVDPQDKYSDSQIHKAISSLDLSKSKLANLNFMIEESGKNISEGEKQQISLIRTVLQNKQIICFDEATSNLDEKNEKIIENYIDGLQNKTVVLITHNLNMLRRFDVIYIIEDGQAIKTTFSDIQASLQLQQQEDQINQQEQQY